MTTKRKVQFRCKECNDTHEIEIYDVIDPNDTPEAKEDILYNRIFDVKCPNCGDLDYKMYFFWYVDDVHNFKIQFSALPKLLQYKVPEDSNYIEVGCCDLKDMISKIICLENGLDYVNEKLIEILFQEAYDSEKEKRGTDVELLFMIQEPGTKDLGYLCLVTNPDGSTDLDTLEFPYDLYEEVGVETSKIRDKDFNYYLFDNQSANKFLKHLDFNDHVGELIIIRTYYGAEIVTKNPIFNEGKYSIDDSVVAYDGEELIKGIIYSILKVNERYSPLFEEDLPILLYKTKQLELTIQEDSDYDLKNDELNTMFFVDEEIEETSILNSNVIVGVEFGLPISELEFMEGETIKPKSKLDSTYDGDKRYLNVYLESKAVDITSIMNHIYNFNDVMNIVLNDPLRFDGICIKSSLGIKKLNHKFLYRYKINRVMAVQDNVKDLLFNLKENEIEYLGQEAYDFISHIYFANCSLVETEKHFGKTREETDKLLKEGYHKLEQIVLCNY